MSVGMLYLNITSGGDMHSSSLRKVGGSVMMAVPPAVLELLQMRAGDKLSLSVEDGRIVVHPQPRPTYSLEQLLAEADGAAPDQDWLDDAPVGAELI